MSCRTVTIGNTATLICAADTGRKMVIISPPTDADSFWSFAGDSALAAGTGIMIPANTASFSYDETVAGAQKPIYAIVASGTAECRVEEIPY